MHVGASSIWCGCNTSSKTSWAERWTSSSARRSSAAPIGYGAARFWARRGQSMSDDTATLLDMTKAANLIRAFTLDLDFKQFSEDRRAQAAVLYEITVLGEAVRRLSSDFRIEHPEIPWREIAGMRDRVVHAYDQVELDR